MLLGTIIPFIGFKTVASDADGTAMDFNKPLSDAEYVIDVFVIEWLGLGVGIFQHNHRKHIGRHDD